MHTAAIPIDVVGMHLQQAVFADGQVRQLAACLAEQYTIPRISFFLLVRLIHIHRDIHTTSIWIMQDWSVSPRPSQRSAAFPERAPRGGGTSSPPRLPSQQYQLSASHLCKSLRRAISPCLTLSFWPKIALHLRNRREIHAAKELIREELILGRQTCICSLQEAGLRLTFQQGIVTGTTKRCFYAVTAYSSTAASHVAGM